VSSRQYRCRAIAPVSATNDSGRVVRHDEYRLDICGDHVFDGRDLTLVVAILVPAAEISRTFFAFASDLAAASMIRSTGRIRFVMSPTRTNPDPALSATAGTRSRPGRDTYETNIATAANAAYRAISSMPPQTTSGDHSEHASDVRSRCAIARFYRKTNSRFSVPVGHGGHAANAATRIAAALGDEQVRHVRTRRAPPLRAGRSRMTSHAVFCLAGRAPCVGAGLADQPSVLRFLDQRLVTLGGDGFGGLYMMAPWFCVALRTSIETDRRAELIAT